MDLDHREGYQAFGWRPRALSIRPEVGDSTDRKLGQDPMFQATASSEHTTAGQHKGSTMRSHPLVPAEGRWQVEGGAELPGYSGPVPLGGEQTKKCG